MADNHVKKFRTGKKLSQRELANLAATSQQQIQRIETGSQVIRLDLATSIAAALEKPLDMVFPALKKQLKLVHKSSKTILKDEEIRKAERESGVDLDPHVWTLRFVLKNGVHRDVGISGGDKARLWSAMQKPHFGFYLFDTPTERIALNAKHVAFWHFLFDPPMIVKAADSLKDEDTYQLKIWLEQSTDPWIVDVEPDREELDTENGFDGAAVQGLFELVEMGGCDVISIEDMDGETAFFRTEHVSMISVPLVAVDPQLLDALDGYEA